MKVGIAVTVDNTEDWDRFLASERHEDVPRYPARSDVELWDEGIAIGLEAEPLGFDSIFCVEHHFTPYSFSTNPLQLLTYFAGRTERVDMGTMVVVLPWNHPLRVAEQATMLQHFIGPDRDVVLGVGRGLARREYQAYGVDMGESRQRFAESVDILRLAVSKDRFEYDGEIYQIPETAMRPYPRDHRLLENLYGAWGTPQSAMIVAEMGLKPFVIPQKPLDEYTDEMREFSAVRAAHGHDPARPMFLAWVYCAPTEDEAREGANRHMRAYARTPVLHYEVGGSHFAGTKGYEQYAKDAERVTRKNIDIAEAMGQVWVDNHIWGTPEQCYEKVVKLQRTWQPEQLIVATNYGTMNFDEALSNTRLFAKEVVPAAQQLTNDVTTAAADR